jgi:hypothetical protein
MDGLKTVTGYEDEKTRSKHIIEKMLFMVELNPVNVKVCRKVFKMIDPDAKPNIYNSPFYTDSDSKLTESWKSKCPVKSFDIIMGNPPYNQGGIRSKKGEKEGIKTIWTLFIEESIKILNKDKYLIFITPNTWTELASPISKIILDLQIEYLKSFNYAESLEKFGKESGKIPLSYYLLRNTNSKNDTKIWDDNYQKFINYNIYKTLFIPNFNVSIFKKVIQKSKNNNLNSYYINTQSKPKELNNVTFSNVNKYPLLNYSNHKINISYSSSCYNGHNKIPKLILSNFSMGYPILDKHGIIDARANMCFIIQLPDNNLSKLKRIQLLLLNDISFLLINSLKTKQNFLSNRIFQILPDVSKLDFEITDENLIEYFGLDEKDIEAIKKQKTSGEGNLTEGQKEEIINFDIEKELTREQIELIKSSIDTECQFKKRRTKKAPRVNANNANTTHTQKASTKVPLVPVEKPPSTNANNASKKVSRVNANVNHTKKASNKTTSASSVSKPSNSSGQGKVAPKTVTIKKKRCPNGEKAAKLKDPKCPPNMIKYTFKTKECCRKK